MMKLIIKYLALLLIFSFTLTPAMAKDPKPIATVQHQIEEEEEDMPKGISFITHSELILKQSRVIIPEGSTVYARIIDTEGERRWHKSGFVILKLKGYESNDDYKDIESRDVYMVGRKYVSVNKKEVAKTAVEVAATTTAGVIVPGADIAYYFTKGLIKKKEGCNRFKSGVETAYENSIFWFWLKGKPLDLEDNALLSFKEITEDEAEELRKKIAKRAEKSERMHERKENFKEFMSY